VVWLTAAAGHGEKESLQPAKNGRMSRPSQPTSLSAGHYSSSQPESRQAKERRKAGSLQSCLLLKELEKGLQPAFCMLLSSVDRSVCPWTYHGPHGGRTNGRTSMVTTHATAAAAKRKQVSFIQKPFSSRGPAAAATELVAQGSYCHHYYSPLLVVVHCCCCYSGW
jgi:hypothetical protein